MDIREAFSAVVSMLREYDGNFGRNSSNYAVERKNLRHYWWKVFETVADVGADYLDEVHDVIITVTRRGDDGYLVYSRPFTWEPQDKYGFTPKMFNHIFSKYDPQLVSACLKVAEESDGMLYSEVKETNGVRRCHYGVRVYNKDTGVMDGVYEGSFPA